MNASSTIELARKHLNPAIGMGTSAEVCLRDAYALLGAGDETHAKARALKSLAYSVGILHPDYRAAA